jgi:mercuric reductase
VLAGVTPSAVSRAHRRYLVTVANGRGETTLSGARLLIATGRRPVTTDLNLDAVRVKTGPGGEVLVDEYLRTHNEGIWAAGDVTGGPQFIYIAAAQGSQVADNALRGAQRTLD